MKAKAILVVLALALVVVPSARATYDPIKSGTTKLTLDKAFLSLLKKGGVKLSAKAPAKRQGKTILIPVWGGKQDPTLGKAEVLHEGAIVFQKDNRKLPLREIELKANAHPLYAKVGGGQLKLASAKEVAAKRAGFGQSFKATGLKLTQKVATRLNKKLRTKDLFQDKQAIGTLTSQVQPQRVTILPQGQATLVPDPQILAKFKSLFVSLNPISPAELSPGPLFRLPIAAGGEIAPDGSEGTLRSAGAIELLQLGAGQIFHQEYWFDLAAKSSSAEVEILPTPAFPGKLGRLGVFAMGAGSVSSDPKSRTVSVSNLALYLDALTAQHFNQAFAEGKAVFVAGEAFGVVGFGAVGQ